MAGVGPLFYQGPECEEILVFWDDLFTGPSHAHPPISLDGCPWGLGPEMEREQALQFSWVRWSCNYAKSCPALHTAYMALAGCLPGILCFNVGPPELFALYLTQPSIPVVTSCGHSLSSVHQQILIPVAGH